MLLLKEILTLVSCAYLSELDYNLFTDNNFLEDVSISIKYVQSVSKESFSDILKKQILI